MNRYDEITEYYEKERWARKVGLELVERATPKKVKETDKMFTCPECDMILTMKYPGLRIKLLKNKNYCPSCGQALKWED